MPVTTIRQAVLGGLAFGLGVMWLWAGAQKLRSPKAFEDACKAKNVPTWVSILTARALPLVEIALGAGLVVRFWVRQAAFISFALLVSFSIVLGFEYFRRSLAGLSAAGDCGCFGKKGRGVLAPMTYASPKRVMPAADCVAARNVVRALVLAVIAWTVAFESSNRCACRR
jgi:uncharacterized membrane protein YphA (DoxX/SURF4 family)